MKSIPLRQLVREPIKVKKITRTGQSVQVTDNGRPLWIINPAIPKENQERRKCEIEEELAEVLRSPASKLSLSKIVLESRR